MLPKRSGATTRFHPSWATNSRRSCATSSDSPPPIPEDFTRSVPNSAGLILNDSRIIFFIAKFPMASTSRWFDITSGIRTTDWNGNKRGRVPAKDHGPASAGTSPALPCRRAVSRAQGERVTQAGLRHERVRVSRNAGQICSSSLRRSILPGQRDSALGKNTFRSGNTSNRTRHDARLKTGSRARSAAGVLASTCAGRAVELEKRVNASRASVCSDLYLPIRATREDSSGVHWLYAHALPKLRRHLHHHKRLRRLPG